jgi:hypothetical protein
MLALERLWKSTRHSKIAGEFGEYLFLYWLSKSGFEIALVDHTGIDLVAYNKRNKRDQDIPLNSLARCIATSRALFYLRPFVTRETFFCPGRF